MSVRIPKRGLVLAALLLQAAAGTLRAESIFITTEDPASIANWWAYWSDGVQVYRANPFHVFGSDISISPNSFRPVNASDMAPYLQQFAQAPIGYSQFVSLQPEPSASAFVQPISPWTGGSQNQYQMFVTLPAADDFQPFYGNPERFGVGFFGGWNGVWYANYSFVLPPDAVNVKLTVHSFWADDRAVLFLNDRPIADRLVQTHAPAVSGPGQINTALHGEDTMFHVFVNTAHYVVHDQSIFNVGGINTLRAVINNTGTGGLSEQAYAFRSPDDRTSLRLNATVEFDLHTPEPGSFLLAAAGLAALAWRRRAR